MAAFGASECRVGFRSDGTLATVHSLKQILLLIKSRSKLLFLGMNSSSGIILYRNINNMQATIYCYYAREVCWCVYLPSILSTALRARACCSARSSVPVLLL